MIMIMINASKSIVLSSKAAFRTLRSGPCAGVGGMCAAKKSSTSSNDGIASRSSSDGIFVVANGRITHKNCKRVLTRTTLLQIRNEFFRKVIFETFQLRREREQRARLVPCCMHSAGTLDYCESTFDYLVD